MTEYFVDATLGSDTASGIWPTPWASQDKVRLESANINSGDRVRFKRGEVFSEPFGLLVFKGDVVYDAYGDEENKPVLEGLTRNKGWSLYSGSIYTVSMHRPGSENEMLWEDGVEGTRQTSFEAITSPRDFYLDDDANVLYYWPSDGVSPDMHVMHFAHAASGLRRFQFTGNNGILRDLDFAFNGSRAALITGTHNTDQSGWEFDGCLFQKSRHHGFQQFANAGLSITFNDCVFRDNWYLGCVFDKGIKDSTFTHLQVLNNGAGMSGGTGWIALATTPNSVFVRDSVAAGNRNAGFADYPAGSRGITFEDCDAYENAANHPDAGGFSTFGIDTVFRRCRSWDNGVAGNTTLGSGFNTDLDSDNTTFDHCIAWNNHSHGFGISQGAGRVGHKILNCIAAFNGTPGTNATLGAGFTFYGMVNPVHNLVMKDNIAYKNGIGTEGWAIYDYAASQTLAKATGVEMSGNIYFDNDEQPNIIKYGGVPYASVEEYKAAVAPLDSDALEEDPRFIDPENGDFTREGIEPEPEPETKTYTVTLPSLTFNVEVKRAEENHD